jgi:hypothetical protein
MIKLSYLLLYLLLFILLSHFVDDFSMTFPAICFDWPFISPLSSFDQKAKLTYVAQPASMNMSGTEALMAFPAGLHSSRGAIWIVALRLRWLCILHRTNPFHQCILVGLLAPLIIYTLTYLLSQILICAVKFEFIRNLLILHAINQVEKIPTAS